MTTRFPIIVGPTAGGKSALAVEVARALVLAGRPAEIISADSVQIFRGMNIGSAKPTADERGGIIHHLIDLCEPDGPPFTVHDWLAEANSLIDRLRGQGVVPVVVGGTHLYIKSLLEGMFEGPGADEGLRAELRGLGPAALRAELERIDPAAARRIHPNDERRTIRAIEVYRLTGRAISEHQSQWDREERVRRDAVLVGLEWEIEEINRRINARVRLMLEQGLLAEVRSLHSAGRLGPQAREALGYKQMIEHLEGRCTLEDAVEAIKIETRRFGKNQRTWLRRLRRTPASLWIEAARIPREQWAEIVRRAIDTPPAG
jgi:tRNA dimethylallyltransferase